MTSMKFFLISSVAIAYLFSGCTTTNSDSERYNRPASGNVITRSRIQAPIRLPIPVDQKTTIKTKTKPRGPYLIQYTETGSIAELWSMYRRFKYEALIEKVTTKYKYASLSIDERSSCWALAGASAYLIWRSADARSFFQKSIQANPNARLDPNVFPTDLCRLYQQMKNDREGR